MRGRRRRDRLCGRYREEIRERGLKVNCLDRRRLLSIQRARRWRRKHRWCRRGIPYVGGEKRGELALQKRGDGLVDALSPPVEVCVVDVRHRVAKSAIRQRDHRERDARAAHVARRAFVPPQVAEESNYVETTNFWFVFSKETPKIRGSVPLHTRAPFSSSPCTPPSTPG